MGAGWRGPVPAGAGEAGSLRVDPDAVTHQVAAGAAGRVVECATPTTGAREEEPYLGESGATPHAALENLFMTELLAWPLDAFHVERADADRVLYTAVSYTHLTLPTN